jgi:hypothetical protein
MEPQTSSVDAKTIAPKTRAEVLREHAFKPGQVANPAGRPKGSRHKLGAAFIEAMHDDFMKNGPAVIEAVRIEKPDQYLKVIASILPKEIDVGEQTLNALSELMDRVDGRTRVVGQIIQAETMQ